MRSKVLNFVSIFISFILGGICVYFFINNIIIPKSSALYSSPGIYSGVVSCDKDITIDETGISLSVGKIYDSVVLINNIQRNTLASTGSGFIYKKDDNYAYIMTNQHVVASASQIIIVLSDDVEIEGTVLGSDEYLDLAVIRISSKNIKSVANIVSSEMINLGDTVFTVGSPLGYNYRGTVTRGSLSGKNRLVTVSVKKTSDFVMKVLQLDAAVNPGNSGGPLCDANGDVIGIISMKLVNENVEGMGFAIPIEDAMNYIDDLEKGSLIERPLIGITMANLTDTYTLRQNDIAISSDIKNGVVVLTVSDGAVNAGLQKGDIITSIDGEEIKNAAYLKYVLFKHTPGDSISISYIRNGKSHISNLILAKNEN